MCCAAAITPVGGGHRRVRTREAICTYKTHIWAVHSRALVPLIPQPPSPTREEGGVWASWSPKRDRERRRLPRTCPCKARTSRPRGASRARCPRSQCGRDARDPRRGRMPASLACGRDARAPRRCRDTNGSSASGTRSLSHYSALARAGGLRPTPPARGGSGVEPGAYGLWRNNPP